MRKEYQALDKQLGLRLKDGTKEVVDMAERKLEIGRKIDNQMVCKDLHDCMQALQTHLGKVDRRAPVISRWKELIEEYDRIKVCFNATELDTRGLLIALDQLSMIENRNV